MRWISLILLFFASLIIYADKQVIGFAAEPLMKEFNLNGSEWGIVGSSFFILFIITSFIGGTWSDRIGTTKMILFVLLGVSIIQFGAFAIVGLPMLILYRVLLGAFEGPFIPSGFNHISRIFPIESRGLAVSIFIAGASMGGVICSPILVALIERFGWQWTFVSLGFVSMLLLVTWALVNRFSKTGQNVTVNQVKKLKWSDIAPVLRNPACLLTIILSAISYWLVIWTALWGPVYLTKVIKLTPMQMAYALSGTGIAALVLIFLISALSDRLYRKTKSFRVSRVWVAAISTMIGGISLGTIPFVGNSFVWVFIALCIAKGSTYISVTMAVQVMIQLMPERAGFMSSILTLGNNTSQLVAPVITGIIVQSAGANLALGFNYSIFLMSGLFLVISTLYLLFVKPDNDKEASVSDTVVG
ncbi:MAG: MFS transporter [Solibacillus sp.]